METKSPQEVAALLGVDEVTIRRLRRKANLPERQRGQGYTLDEIELLRAQQRYKVHTAEPAPVEVEANIARQGQANNTPLASELPTRPSEMTARYDHLLSPSWESQPEEALPADLSEQLASIARQNDRIIAQNDRIEQRLMALNTLLAAAARPAIEALPLTADTSVPSQRHLRGISKADAGRLLARHGLNANTAKGWKWPDAALISERAALTWALNWVAGDRRRGGEGWKDYCNVPDCPCQEMSDR